MCNFNLPEEQVYTKTIPPIDNPKKPKKKKEKTVTILKKGNPSIGEDNNLDAKEKGPLKLEVKILCCETPSLLYVRLLDQEKQMKALYSDLQEYYSNNEEDAVKNWNVNDLCCAICNDSKTWRRAKILQLTGDEAELLFIDFGIKEKVNLEGLRALPKKFAEPRAAAIRCHLSGIVPGAGDTWPFLTIQHLKDRIDAYRRFVL